jgi:hypothetical protein
LLQACARLEGVERIFEVSRTFEQCCTRVAGTTRLVFSCGFFGALEIR